MLTYVKDRILDELKDALNYMQKAVENKKKECGQIMYHIAEDELKHANYMLKVFRMTEKPKTVSDAEYSEMQKAILDAYSEDMGKFETMKKLYWSE